MAGAQYLVVLHRGQWKISFNGYFYGPYNFKTEAITVAVEEAHKMGSYEAQVLVQGIDRQIRCEWTYGHSDYPLRGPILTGAKS